MRKEQSVAVYLTRSILVLALASASSIFSGEEGVAENEYDPFDFGTEESFLDSTQKQSKTNAPENLSSSKDQKVQLVKEAEAEVDAEVSAQQQRLKEVVGFDQQAKSLSESVEKTLGQKLVANLEEEEESLDELVGDLEVEGELLSKENPYRLQIGDKIYITIYGEQNTGRVGVVDYTGRISYLLVDSIYVLGRTIDEVRRELDEKIKPFFKHAFVTVTPVEFGGQYYTILGQVAGPGKKLLEGKETVLEAICKAGGFTTGSYRGQTIEMADFGHAFLARDGDYVPVDFERLVLQGDMRENISIESGDYLYIPNSLYREIYVIGEVNAPTTMGYVNTVTLVEALAEARGVTQAASSRAIVIRGSLANPTRYEIDINRIFKGKERDFVLQPGDIVFVPKYKFTNLEQVTKSAISAFVGAVASTAGARTFQETHPHNDAEGPVLTFPVNP